MTAPRDIAEAFSSHRFSEAYEHLAPDIRWVLVGADPLEGRDNVIAACEATRADLDDTATEVRRFLVIADASAVAVNTVTRYVAPDGTASSVASCDLYEFDHGLVVTITSYTIEVA